MLQCYIVFEREGFANATAVRTFTGWRAYERATEFARTRAIERGEPHDRYRVEPIDWEHLV